MFSKRSLILPLILLAVLGTHAGSVLAIDTPRDLRGTEIRQNTVKWEWSPVDGAVAYEVTLNGQRQAPTQHTKFYTYDHAPGQHSFFVQAVDADGNVSNPTQQAQLSTSVTFQFGTHGRSVLVGTPPAAAGSSAPAAAASTDFSRIQVQGLRSDEYSGSDVRWQWNSLDGAVNYEVTIDGMVAGTTANTEWISRDLWEGTHSLTVKGINSAGTKTEQSDTLKIEVSGNGSGSIPGDPAPAAEIQSDAVTSAPPPQNNGGDPNAANIQALIDPDSWNYREVYQKEGYELVFSDEFNGTALNPYRWSSQLRWDGEFNGERYEYRVVNGEDQFYVNILSSDEEHLRKVAPVFNPFKFNGNRLAIQAIKNPLKTSNDKRSYGSLDEMVSQQNFLSGVIASHGKFSQKYGYFEARIKIPSHVGAFPAFWLFHERRAWEGTQRTEIDVMENLGHAPHYIYNSFHFFKNVNEYYGGDANFIKPYPSGQVFTGTDYSQDFHVYAVEWTPNKIVWLIDGVKVSELEHPEVNFEELYVKLNLAMGGNWTNFPANAGGLGRSASERFPNPSDLNNFNSPMLEIDYVRAYKRW